MGILLQKESLEPDHKKTTVAIVHKIQGTELFSLLENSFEGASKKIAELLDSTISTEKEGGFSSIAKEDYKRFDIKDFL